MCNHVNVVKEKLSEAISQLCKVSWLFAKDPKRNFTRNRKLPFEKVISFLLAMEGGTLTSELLKHFGCSDNTASSSALVQQRSKIDPAAFSSLFDLFVQKTEQDVQYKGYHLIAADGSDLQIPTKFSRFLPLAFPPISRYNEIMENIAETR